MKKHKYKKVRRTKYERTLQKQIANLRHRLNDQNELRRTYQGVLAWISGERISVSASVVFPGTGLRP